MTEGERIFRELLDGISELQLREICIEAVRRIRRTGDKASTKVIDPSTFQHQLVPLLINHRAEDAAKGNKVASLETHLGEEWTVPILGFLHWLQQTGLAFPLPFNRYRLMPSGLSFFDSVVNEHPLVPGGLDRLRKRCPGLPDDVDELLDDAHACFKHGLLRPAVALLGVAMESLSLVVHEAMVTRGIVTQPTAPKAAAQRITAIRSGLSARFPSNAGSDLEGRAFASRCCDFADHLRTRRNDASHPIAKFPFDDRQEVEELLVSAHRYIPGLWAVV